MKATNKNNSPFQIPENYFEDFSARINTKIQTTEQKQQPNKSFIRLLKPALLMAVSFAIIFSLVYFPVKIYIDNSESFQNKKIVSRDEIRIDAVEENEAAAYQLNEDWSDDEMVEYLSANLEDYELYSEIIY